MGGSGIPCHSSPASSPSARPAAPSSRHSYRAMWSSEGRQESSGFKGQESSEGPGKRRASWPGRSSLLWAAPDEEGGFSTCKRGGGGVWGSQRLEQEAGNHGEKEAGAEKNKASLPSMSVGSQPWARPNCREEGGLAGLWPLHTRERCENSLARCWSQPPSLRLPSSATQGQAGRICLPPACPITSFA